MCWNRRACAVTAREDAYISLQEEVTDAHARVRSEAQLVELEANLYSSSSQVLGRWRADFPVAVKPRVFGHAARGALLHAAVAGRAGLHAHGGDGEARASRVRATPPLSSFRRAQEAAEQVTLIAAASFRVLALRVVPATRLRDWPLGASNLFSFGARLSQRPVPESLKRYPV